MPTNTIKTLCERDGISIRTAQRHVKKLGVGTMYAKTIVLDDAEWSRVLASIKAARPGRRPT